MTDATTYECPRCGAGRAKNTPCLCGRKVLPVNSFCCCSCPFAVPDVRELRCQLCGGYLKMVNLLRGPVQTTQVKTATARQYSGHVRLRRSRAVSRDHDRAWVFTDGATRGSYAAVVLSPGQEPLHLSRFVGPMNLPQRNVTAEMMGVALGLNAVPEGSRVMVVSDYMGTGCWLAGQWKIKNPDALLRLRLIARLIRTRGLEVSFIHHKGHQVDDTDFTRWNNAADKLCEEAAEERCWCSSCGSLEVEEWGESGRYWIHCYACGQDGPDMEDTDGT